MHIHMNMGVFIGTNLAGVKATWLDRVELNQMGISQKYA